MSKRKVTEERPEIPMSIELDEEQIAALQLAPTSLPPSLQCLLPALESITKAYAAACGADAPPHKRVLPTRQATDFKSTTEAAEALGIEYNEDDPSYYFNLKAEYLQNPGTLSEHFASVIKDLKNSAYLKKRNDESFCRTIVDLILLDRLCHLEDRDSYHRLQVTAEIPVKIRIKNLYGNEEMIKGRADWALGYGANKTDTGALLIVAEAKPYASAAVGLPQLLVYMAAVFEARKDRINQSVFGMLSDSRAFSFAFLDDQKKLFTTKWFIWTVEESTIIGYLDMMLLSAIESSPHTTPQKHQNRTLLLYPKILGNKWQFGEAMEEDYGKEKEEGKVEEEEEEEGEDDDKVVDVVKLDGRLILKRSTQLTKAREEEKQVDSLYD